MKKMLWNVVVSISGIGLGLTVAAGFVSVGMPAGVAGTIGTAAYIFALLANVK